MRIQHNIMAMNAYRNYNTNTSALSKNLEKLSSGYQINRAGDDAAGLAISEKMRAQITGLDVAQKNAKDGISLVQTAEGALTEVHDMLNRMVELANQSANGTYDETDRVQLQKEVDQLTEEIDRIADSSNFNGIKLLNGDLGSSGASGVAVDVKYDNLANNTAVLALQEATAASASITKGATDGLTASTEYTIKMQFKDANGSLQEKEVTFKNGTDTGADGGNQALMDAIQSAVGDGYTVTGSDGNDITITSNNPGADDEFQLFSFSVRQVGGTADVATITAGTSTAGVDAYYRLSGTDIGAYDGTGNASDYIFSINGQKFAFATAEGAKKLDSDVNYILTTSATPTTTEVSSMVSMINNKTGIGAVAQGNTNIDLKAGTKAGTTGNGLTLQIGDTSDSFNQLNVTVDDCHAQALGIAGIDISTQTGAQNAVEVIKNAIDMVSDIRGGLGATQNRLDHTINNLSVMQENIQDAESSIRDTDVADEMMEYTKNNILIQSAQAMLAQANQVPQGVLQLLQ